MKNITVKSYTLREKNGDWLAQVLLSSDGMFSSVSDWGNFSYAWRSTGVSDFRLFIMETGTEYFGGKIYQGMTYFISGKKYKEQCVQFAEKVLPALKEAIKEELETERKNIKLTSNGN